MDEFSSDRIGHGIRAREPTRSPAFERFHSPRARPLAMPACTILIRRAAQVHIIYPPLHVFPCCVCTSGRRVRASYHTFACLTPRIRACSMSAAISFPGRLHFFPARRHSIVEPSRSPPNSGEKLNVFPVKQEMVSRNLIPGILYY